MTTEQFCYWLQGFAEIQTLPPTGEQWKIINDHLALVFDKKTPDRKMQGTLTMPYNPAPNVQPIGPFNPYRNDIVYEKKDPLTPPYTVTCSANGKN